MPSDSVTPPFTIIFWSNRPACHNFGIYFNPEFCSILFASVKAPICTHVSLSISLPWPFWLRSIKYTPCSTLLIPAYPKCLHLFHYSCNKSILNLTHQLNNRKSGGGSDVKWYGLYISHMSSHLQILKHYYNWHLSLNWSCYPLYALFDILHHYINCFLSLSENCGFVHLHMDFILHQPHISGS